MALQRHNYQVIFLQTALCEKSTRKICCSCFKNHYL